MELERTNVWLQLSGMIGLIASLTFVGLQLKQSQDIAIAAQYGDRSAEATQYWRFVAEFPELLEDVGKRHREHVAAANNYNDELSDEQIGLRYVQTRSYIESWDNNYFQYISGFMAEESWAVYESRLRRGCSSGGIVRAILVNHPEAFRQSFVNHCLQDADV